MLGYSILTVVSGSSLRLERIEPYNYSIYSIEICLLSLYVVNLFSLSYYLSGTCRDEQHDKRSRT